MAPPRLVNADSTNNRVARLLVSAAISTFTFVGFTWFWPAHFEMWLGVFVASIFYDINRPARD